MELKPIQTETRSSSAADELRETAESMVSSGETLLGFCSGSWKRSLISQAGIAVAITERSLRVLPYTSGGRPKRDEEFSLRMDDLVKASTSAFGPSMAKSFTLKLRTRLGDRYIFRFADGTGVMAGMFSGANEQRDGIAALEAFLVRANI